MSMISNWGTCDQIDANENNISNKKKKESNKKKKINEDGVKKD